MLGILALNGGPTVTHLPQPGSPVIDAGDDAEVPVRLEFDQRGSGFLRVAGFQVDPGSVEVQDPVQTGPSFVVNSDDDTDDGSCREAPGHCSLREALIAANANADASTITFDKALLEPAATIILAGSRLPAVTTAISILGSGITVDGNQLSGLLAVTGGAGSLTVSQMTLANGSAAVTGGAIDLTGGATLVLRDSTLSNNASSFGGALSVSGSTVQLINSTLTGNSASTSGGGLFGTGASVEFIQSTLSGNQSAAGAGFYNASGHFALTNSIVANSVDGPDCEASGGTFTLNGVNLVENPGACGLAAGADLIEGTDPALGPLADNGGPTFTLQPLIGSPVVESDDALVIPVGLIYDQRGPGFERLRGVTVDLGAVELQFPDPNVIFSDGFERAAEPP